MGNLKIKLSDRIIRIENFNLCYTYAGLMAGEPDEEINEEILKRFSYPSEWGNRRAIYKETNIFKTRTELKPIIYSAWLSSEPINDVKGVFDGSTIIMVWFGNEQPNTSIEQIILNGIGSFDWDDYAGNYNY